MHFFEDLIFMLDLAQRKVPEGTPSWNLNAFENYFSATPSIPLTMTCFGKRQIIEQCVFSKCSELLAGNTQKVCAIVNSELLLIEGFLWSNQPLYNVSTCRCRVMEHVASAPSHINKIIFF